MKTVKRKDCLGICLFLFLEIILFIYSLVCTGSSLLRGLFSSSASRSYSLVALHGCLFAMASFVAELGL